jgi:hypothetical protein
MRRRCHLARSSISSNPTTGSGPAQDWPAPDRVLCHADFADTDPPVDLLHLLPGLLVLIPIGWLIDTLVNFTIIAMIEEELGIFPAISRAWQVIIRNLGHVLVMFLILGVGGLIVGLIISAPLIIIPCLWWLTCSCPAAK